MTEHDPPNTPTPVTTPHKMPALGLACPACGGGRLPVLYTRQKARCILRVRECQDCGRRVITRERM